MHGLEVTMEGTKTPPRATAGARVGDSSLSDRRPTGNEQLDHLLGGGLPNASTTLLVSDSMTAPYVFAEQFAAAGLALGKPVLYYGFDRPRRHVEDRLRARLPAKGTLDTLHYADYYALRLRALSQSIRTELGIPPADPELPKAIVPALLGQPKGQRFRLVLESLSEVVRAYGAEASIEIVNEIVGILSAREGAGLLLLDRGIIPPELEAGFRHTVDNVFEFGLDRQNNDIRPFFKITKMLRIPGATHLYWYSESAEGLSMEAVHRVF